MLLRRFKLESDIQQNLQDGINETVSMLKVMWWLEWLNGDLGQKVHNNGPSCCDEEGNWLIYHSISKLSFIL